MDNLKTAGVSVIMPAYNAARTLVDSARSVLAQTYPNLELLIVDDGSSDATPTLADSLAAEDPRVRVLHNGSNRGIVRARNLGLKEASYEVIAFCDSDDLWRPDKLAKQIAAMEKNAAALVYTGSAFIGENGTRYSYCMRVPETVNRKTLRCRNVISNSSVVMRKDVFRENLVALDDIHEDYACWLNLLKKGEKAVGINEPLLIYRVSGSSRTGNKLKSARRTWRTYQAVGIRGPERVYCMARYTVHGVIKYWKLRRSRISPPAAGSSD